ncbi:hypothetical protein BCY86_02000 [Pajaroellobacter abortibovis]|uniref:Phospholipid/glycerol acyltransferase domain-containing protein n=1 Tax=Pajaroellobacter abortibovis TaxID=1882918 RepID=A0A1L6MVN8_9BACT|nr:hypothetical protein BCY86_02000 [Pajaroellobacter abortibovis]
MYVITSLLVRHGLRHRLLFPVRSTFFYDHPLGLVINGTMSFFAMYPPFFRDKKRALLNHQNLTELTSLLRRGNTFVGIHPEGTRNTGEDPYTLLPAQNGTGRLIYEARVPVLPVFINGLTNHFIKQIYSNWRHQGEHVIIVFGEPIALSSLLDLPPSFSLYKQITNKTLIAIHQLGQEEKKLRSFITKTQK